MSSHSYSAWLRAQDKNALAFYNNTKFRQLYTERELKGKAKLFKNKVVDEVRAALRNIRTQTDKIRILSLGCGPGSDLLGILQAVKSALISGDPDVGWDQGQLTCDCTGVDAFDWDWRELRRQAEKIQSDSVLEVVLLHLVREDMESFVSDSSTANGLIGDKFDFICLSFADAGSYMELVGAALPKLLSKFGRIFVLDINIPTVRQLSEYGYECTFNRNELCMHVRGQNINRRRIKFKPSQSSPYKSFFRRAR